jgi:hypothetical protein
LSRFISSSFDFDVITDDVGSHDPRRHRVDPPLLNAPLDMLAVADKTAAGTVKGSESPGKDAPCEPGQAPLQPGG